MRNTVRANFIARRVSFRPRMAFYASGVNQWSYAAAKNHDCKIPMYVFCLFGSGHAYASAKSESMRFIWLKHVRIGILVL